MLTDEERKQIAARAVHQAEIDRCRDTRDWSLRYAGAATIRTGEIFVESPNGRCEIHDFIVELMVERDEWKRRAERHGCNVDGGDGDCG